MMNICWDSSTEILINTEIPVPICILAFRKEKELLKALETPEEKRARRLAKKVCLTKC